MISRLATATFAGAMLGMASGADPAAAQNGVSMSPFQKLDELGAHESYRTAIRGAARDAQVFGRETPPQELPAALIRGVVQRLPIPLNDFTIPPKAGEKRPCYVFSLSTQDNIRAMLRAQLGIPIEPSSRASLQDFALWVFLHEIGHCGQNVTDENRRHMEAQADAFAIREIEARTPGTAIREMVLSYRALFDTYINALALDAVLEGRPEPAPERMIQANIEFSGYISELAPMIEPAQDHPHHARMTSQDIRVMMHLAAFEMIRMDPAASDDARRMAELRISGVGFFMPETFARVMPLARTLPARLALPVRPVATVPAQP